MRCTKCKIVMEPVFSDPSYSVEIGVKFVSNNRLPEWTMGFKCPECGCCCTLNSVGTEIWYETEEDMK